MPAILDLNSAPNTIHADCNHNFQEITKRRAQGRGFMPAFATSELASDLRSKQQNSQNTRDFQVVVTLAMQFGAISRSPFSSSPLPSSFYIPKHHLPSSPSSLVKLSSMPRRSCTLHLTETSWQAAVDAGSQYLFRVDTVVRRQVGEQTRERYALRVYPM